MKSLRFLLNSKLYLLINSNYLFFHIILGQFDYITGEKIKRYSLSNNYLFFAPTIFKLTELSTDTATVNPEI